MKALSIIVPALNEEGNILKTCEGITPLAERYLSDYEILVFDDGSSDRTAEVVKVLRRKNNHVLLFQNPVTRGLGYNYRMGVLKAKCPYAVMVPGDNEIVGNSLEELFKRVGSVDLLISYPSNSHIRPLSRRWLSKGFMTLMNLLFGLKIRYYNGPSVIPTEIARQFVPRTDGFAYMAVTLVRSIKAGYSYQEVPCTLQERQHGKSKAFRLKNVVSVVRDIALLFWRVYVGGRSSIK